MNEASRGLVSAARALQWPTRPAPSAPWSPGVAESPRCNRCGFPVTAAPWGCKNPCLNCGTVYPLGDCSD
jgi:hypothetical protein